MNLQIHEFVNTVNKLFSINPPIKFERVNMGYEIENLFYEMVKNCLTPPSYRVVGCAALGKMAKWNLARLKGTPLEPTELWDKDGDGVTVKKSDYSILNNNDIIIISTLPESSVTAEIFNDAKKSGCAILMMGEIEFLLNQYYTFPELIKIGRPLLKG